MAKEKARYFTFILYPESIPADWIEKLESLGYPIAISPLHDKDKSDLEGQEYKKPHYHIIYVANNPVTADSVRVKIKRLLGNKSIAKVQIVATSVENTYLYLTHQSKDAIAKNKHIYDKDDIVHLNNFDIDRYITVSVEEKEDLYNLVCDLIIDYDLANIKELKYFVLTKGNQYGISSMRQINEVIRSYTGLIRLYFDAVYQDRKYGSTVPKVDYSTGEILEENKKIEGQVDIEEL